MWKEAEVGMNDRAYIVSRTLENKIMMAENNGNNALIVTLDVLKEILALLKEQDDIGKELTDAMELIHKKNERIKKLEEQIETLTKWRANAGAFD